MESLLAIETLLWFGVRAHNIKKPKLRRRKPRIAVFIAAPHWLD
jgi:hypothetical protein